MALTGQPYFHALLGDAEVAALLGRKADIAALLRFEAALAKAQAEAGMITAADAATIRAALDAFEPDMERLTASTLKDGVPVPGLVQQLREHVGGEAAKALHLGATSQDVVDTALALKLKTVFDCFESRLMILDGAFDALLQRFGSAPLMGRSRMQAAIAMTAGDRIAVWRDAVANAGAALAAQKPHSLILSLAGAVGTSEKFGDAITSIRHSMATELGLAVPAYGPHADRGRIADLGNALSRITGALGKLGQDVALMAQNGIGTITLSGGGGSSAMPHKQNPVRAEVLVALARFNAVQLSALHQSLVHEQERSGAAWTLEWLVLPQMLEATGAALTHAIFLLDHVERIGDPA